VHFYKYFKNISNQINLLQNYKWYNILNIINNNWEINKMPEKDWYIALEYPLMDADRTMKILEILDYKKHKVLCARAYYFLSDRSEEDLQEDMDWWFECFMTGIAWLGNITDRAEFNRIMRNVFLKKYGTNQEEINFINEGEFFIHKLMCRYTDSDEAILNDLHFAGYKLIKKMTETDLETLNELRRTFLEITHDTSKIIKTEFSPDRIRFAKQKPMGLGNYINTITNSYVYDNIFTWFEIDDEKDLKTIVNRSELDLIITDDLNNINNYFYYINIFHWPHDNIRFAIHGDKNKLETLANNELLEICSDEDQFTKFNDSLVKYLTNKY